MSHTLAETYQYASQFCRLIPLTFAAPPTGARTGDPALSIGDWVRQTIVSPPFSWRWNRASITPINTVAAIQDYSFTTVGSATMTAPTLVSITNNVMTISSAAFGATSAFGATVNFSGFTDPALTFLNGTTALVITSSLTTLVCAYQHGNLAPTAATSGVINAYVLSSFGWLEKASITYGGNVTKELDVLLNLADDTTQGQPRSIASIIENNSGAVTLRLLPAPDKVYALRANYQKQAPTFTSTAGTWDPIPDYMFHIYSQGVLAKAYEYFGDERYPLAMMSFFKQLISFHGGLTESQVNIFMDGRTNTQTGIQAALAKINQAVAARGLQ